MSSTASSENRLLAGLAVVVHRYDPRQTVTVGHATGDRVTAMTFRLEPGIGFRDLLATRETADEAECLAVASASGITGAGFDKSTLRRMPEQLRVVLDAAQAEPDVPVSRLDLLSKPELDQILVEWNATGLEMPSGQGIHRVFEATAAANPEGAAVIHGDTSHSFATVNREANRIANYLREQGFMPGSRVGLCLGRGPELVFAMWGVLKAGCCYVPLDPHHPEERIATMIARTGCATTLTHSAHVNKLGSAASRILEIDKLRSRLLDTPEENPELAVGPDDLCYIMHTSGSTGQPKPIALRHQGVLNNLLDLNQRLEVGAADTVLSVSAASFDMSVYELLGVCLAGGTVVLPDADSENDVLHLTSLLHRHNVTMWSSAPAILGALLDERAARNDRAALPLRLAMLAGDWIPVTLPDRLRQAAPGTRVYALGGATEASIYSTVYEVKQVGPDWTSVPYGVPMRNQQTFILDEHGKPAPVGVAGELHLAGIGLAQGYFNEPERTAERFFTWSYGPISETRLYKTGDAARYREDGVIELLGRLDQQVKINGLRIELGEIEVVLARSAEVRQAMVLARSLPGDRCQLVGYVVPEPGHEVRPGELLDQVAAALPRYMVPAAIIVLPKMPLNAHGKIDRAALPSPELHRGAEPLGPEEKHVAAVFGELLKLDHIGREQNLFELGVDSITMLRAMTRIHSGLVWSDMFASPDVEGLARRVKELEHVATRLG